MNKIKIAAYAAIAIGLIVLLSWLFRSCDNPPSHKVENDDLLQVQEKFKVEEKKRFEKIDSLESLVKQKDLDIADLSEAKAKVEKQLAKQGTTVTMQAHGVKEAKAHNDTASYVRNCDSLADNSIAQQATIESYQQVSDSLLLVTRKQSAEKDSINAAHRAAYVAQAGVLNKTTDDYKGLFTDYNNVSKKYKHERTRTRVAAAAALVLAGILILKK